MSVTAKQANFRSLCNLQSEKINVIACTSPKGVIQIIHKYITDLHYEFKK